MTTDVNCTQHLTAGDAQQIFENFLGMISLPPCCADYYGQNKLLSLDFFQDNENSLKSIRKLYPLNTIGHAGDLIQIPVVLTHPTGIRSFGFEINYPTDLLEFLGMNRAPLTRNFKHLSATEDVLGVVKVEGESTDPVETSPVGSLVVLIFSVKDGMDASLPLIIFNPDRDLYYVEIQEGTFSRLKYFKNSPRILSFGSPEFSANGRLLIPLKVSCPFNLKSFGLKLKYSEEKMTFIGVKRRKLTKDFIGLDGNEVSPGHVNIGGYGASGIQKKTQGVLVDLVFSIREKGGEIEILNLFDDIRKFTIKKKRITVN